MKPRYDPADHPIDPPDDDNATTDALPDPMDSMMPEAAGLRVVNAAMARVIAQQATQLMELLGPDQTAKIARAKNAQLAVTARLLQNHTARGPTSEWLTIKKASFRYGCTGERMRQIAKAGGVAWRRDGGGPISIFAASLDERLRLLGREPKLTKDEQLAAKR